MHLSFRNLIDINKLHNTLDQPSTNPVESMDFDYGPALPPRLDSHSSRVDASGHNISSVEEPSRLPSAKPKKSSHSFKQYDVVPSSASDHYSDQSDNPRPTPNRAKKHTDKSNHKSRSRYLPSSSEEDQSSELRHRSPKPSRKTYTDQDHPQHDPDPPYYREVALSDIPSQYAEEVDTFRRVLKLPYPRDSLPRSSTAVMGLDDEKGRQELRPRGPSSMLPLNSIIKDALINLTKIFKQQIYLRVNTLKLLLPLHQVVQGGTTLFRRQDTRTKIQTLPRSVFLLSPLGPLWARFPYQFSKNWNTRRDKISPRLTLLPPLPSLLLPAIPLWKSASIV